MNLDRETVTGYAATRKERLGKTPIASALAAPWGYCSALLANFTTASASFSRALPIASVSALVTVS